VPPWRFPKRKGPLLPAVPRQQPLEKLTSQSQGMARSYSTSRGKRGRRDIPATPRFCEILTAHPTGTPWPRRSRWGCKKSNSFRVVPLTPHCSQCPRPNNHARSAAVPDGCARGIQTGRGAQPKDANAVRRECRANAIRRLTGPDKQTARLATFFVRMEADLIQRIDLPYERGWARASVFLEIILSAQPCRDLIQPARGLKRGSEPCRRDSDPSHFHARPDRHRHARVIQLCADHVLKLACGLPLFAHRVPIETIGRVKRGIGAAAGHTAWQL
jgi:hypothetical protein